MVLSWTWSFRTSTALVLSGHTRLVPPVLAPSCLVLMLYWAMYG